MSPSYTEDMQLIEQAKQNKKNNKHDTIILNNLENIKDRIDNLSVKQQAIYDKAQTTLDYYEKQIILANETYNKEYNRLEAIFKKGLEIAESERNKKIIYFEKQIEAKNQVLKQDLSLVNHQIERKTKVIKRKAQDVKNVKNQIIVKQEILEEESSSEEEEIVVKKKTKKVVTSSPKSSPLELQYVEYRKWRDSRGDNIPRHREIQEKFPLVAKDLEEKYKEEDKKVEEARKSRVVPKDEVELAYEAEQQKKAELAIKRKERIIQLEDKIEKLKALQYASYDVSEDWDADPQYQKLRGERIRYENMVLEMKQNPSLLL